MINTEKFNTRLQKIMDFHGLSASAFADKIGVQRSSISHVLSGRNKPSLDFIMKVLSEFKEVDLYWLINGKGSFPSETPPNSKPSATAIQKMEQPIDDAIDRIVIFYKDGRFKSYKN